MTPWGAQRSLAREAVAAYWQGLNGASSLPDAAREISTGHPAGGLESFHGVQEGADRRSGGAFWRAWSEVLNILRPHVFDATTYTGGRRRPIAHDAAQLRRLWSSKK